MKKFYILVIISCIGFTGLIKATTYHITNATAGFTFSPDSINIVIGDTVVWTLASMHNVVEVNKDVWEAKGNTSNGGFSLGFGGGTLVFKTAGVFYYVCFPHASLGMRGIIVVNNPTSVMQTNLDLKTILQTYPNPARDYIFVDFSVPENNISVKLELIDMTGKIVNNFISENFSKGTYHNTYYLNNITSGRYFLRYSYGTKSFAKSIIINTN